MALKEWVSKSPQNRSYFAGVLAGIALLILRGASEVVARGSGMNVDNLSLLCVTGLVVGMLIGSRQWGSRRLDRRSLATLVITALAVVALWFLPSPRPPLSEDLKRHSTAIMPLLPLGSVLLGSLFMYLISVTFPPRSRRRRSTNQRP